MFVAGFGVTGEEVRTVIVCAASLQRQVAILSPRSLGNRYSRPQIVSLGPASCSASRPIWPDTPAGAAFTQPLTICLFSRFCNAHLPRAGRRRETPRVGKAALKVPHDALVRQRTMLVTVGVLLVAAAQAIPKVDGYSGYDLARRPPPGG
ncbi:hypothetical protein E2C01_027491 [Portunus trituberculatus]|uniref:Uncharacterized protein n=1 Tax=Portunus trituberculatus TaxID=210409 RepID=A0A5B7EI92_PORTR|nr:hypothetical protein [Portunus trituberculatus]